MSENIQRSTGQPRSYKFDRGGLSAEFGPFIGTVVNNVDPTRSGRIQVVIQQFGSESQADDPSTWRTVVYCPPFLGASPKSSSSQGPGSYGQTNNQQSYGMWFTPPDIGVQVLCFFVAGDPSLGYYVGCIPGQGITHMTPTIGSAKKFVTQNAAQAGYLSSSKRLPVTEINNSPENTEFVESPKFFDKEKPVHSYAAAILFQQGLSNDPIRGPITTSSQRESPSNAYGISTPGRAIYRGGMSDTDLLKSAASASPQSVDVVGRRGGHSFIMDDGNTEGADNLIRIRTSKGHQITMSDDGNCFYIAHSNGQVWIEFGQEGTIDMYSTNSINLSTSGSINLHADEDININAGRSLNLRSQETATFQCEDSVIVSAGNDMKLYSIGTIGIAADMRIALQSLMGGSWFAGARLGFKAARIDLNGAAAAPVIPPFGLVLTKSPDTVFNNSKGWTVKQDAVESICTRVPRHEPWPYHNQGVASSTSFETGQPGLPPGAPAMPAGWSIITK